MDDLVAVICKQIVAVTDGRLRPEDLNADTQLWSLVGDETVDIESIEILLLLNSLEGVLGRPLPSQVELLTTVTIGQMAALLADGAPADR